MLKNPLFGLFGFARARQRMGLLVGVVGGAFLWSILFLATPHAFAASRQLTFMAGGAKGSWYRYLTAMGECLRKNSDLRVTVVPTSGGMEAFKKLQDGKADVGFTFQTVAVPAWYGKGPWKGKKQQSLLAVGVGISMSVFHFVTLKSSNITKLADLAGKKYSPCPVGTTCFSSVTTFLKEIKLYNKIKVMNLSHGEQVSYLKDGKIDGYSLQGGFPNPSVSEAALTRPVRLIGIDKELKLSGFLKKYQGFERAIIPAGTYRGVDYDVPTIGISGVLVAQKKAPVNLIYKMTKTVWSKACVNYLTANNKGLSALKNANPTEGLAIPLHPGAERYWKERGIAIKAPSHGQM